MMILRSTDILRIITGVAGSSINVHASWVDDGTFTPAAALLAPITTASTTTVVPSPASGFRRNVKEVTVTNNSSLACLVDVEVFDGTNTSKLISVTLLAGEKLALGEKGLWSHNDANGALYGFTGGSFSESGFTGVIAESMPRQLCPEVPTTAGASGTLFMQSIYLSAGKLVSNIILFSSTTAAGTPTNYLAGFYDLNRNLLAQSANRLTEAWAANSQKSFPMLSPYRVPTSGLYYVGYFMTATTVATLKGGTAKTGGQLAGLSPILHGTSSTGLTTALPNPAAAITAGTVNIYVAIS